MKVMEDILEWLKLNKLDTYNMFNRGASSDDLMRLKKEFPSISNDLLSFYSLVDGQKSEANTFVNGFWLPSIKELLSYREAWRDILKKEIDINDSDYGIYHSPELKNLFWNDQWMPFLISSDNDFGYIIDFDPAPNGKSG